MGRKFPPPKDHYDWNQREERRPDNLLVATWNIANMGKVKRSAGAIELIAQILRRFDLIAVQELDRDYRVIEQVINAVGRSYEYMFNDIGADDERLAFVYLPEQVERCRFAGELALAPHRYPTIQVSVRHTHKGEWTTTKYPGVQFKRTSSPRSVLSIV